MAALKKYWWVVALVIVAYYLYSQGYLTPSSAAASTQTSTGVTADW